MALEGWTLPLSTYPPDRGCHLAPSCLSCPFAVCKQDDPVEFKRAWENQRATQIMELREDGMGVKDVAVHLGISERSVTRIVAVARQNGGMVR